MSKSDSCKLYANDKKKYIYFTILFYFTLKCFEGSWC